jgi:hypothetical protein
MAWEYNCPIVITPDCGKSPPKSYVQTTNNVIVEVIRREGDEIELRMAECLGKSGDVSITVDLPHSSASLTDLLGGNLQPLSGSKSYTFKVRPQQIITMRLHTQTTVEQIQPLTEWDELVPEAKRVALNSYLRDKKGHPPRGN